MEARGDMAAAGDTLLIVNPTAGAHNAAKLWPQIQAHLKQRGVCYDAVFTEKPGHAIALAADGVARGYTTIVSVGGDGTLNEVVNGVMAAPDPLHSTVAVVPVGTGGDFVRMLGLPRSWPDACDRLTSTATHLVDLGELTFIGETGEQHRYFINVAGLGFDGEVAARTNTSPVKRLGGTLPFVTNLVLTLITYSNKDVTVSVDDEQRPGRMNSVVVANGQWFGGGMWISPNSSPDDGVFDVIVIGDVGKVELLQTMPRLYKGTHLTHPKLSAARAQSVQVVSQQEMWLQADGELLGRAPVTFRMHHEALRLRV